MVYSCNYHAVSCPKQRRVRLADGVARRLKRIIREGDAVQRAEVIDEGHAGSYGEVILDTETLVFIKGNSLLGRA
jgi:hypothetical protein